MPSETDFKAELQPEDLDRLIKDLRAFSPKLEKQLRTRLRLAGEVAVRDVQHRILTGPAKRDVGLRRALAAGTKVRVRAGKYAGVRISTTGLKLPAEKQAMVRAYNKDQFTHPVFDHRRRSLRHPIKGAQVMVTQKGRPYFGSVLSQHKANYATAVQRALRDAAGTIRAGTVT